MRNKRVAEGKENHALKTINPQLVFLNYLFEIPPSSE